MWKWINSPLGVGIIGGAGGNALWALASNITLLKPYVPALSSPVSVPRWLALGVAGFLILAVPRLVGTWPRRRNPKPNKFVPNEAEMAVVVVIRAQDRPLPDDEIIRLIVQSSPDHIGREDVRIAIDHLQGVGWLATVLLPFGEVGYALTAASLAFASQKQVKPYKPQVD